MNDVLRDGLFKALAQNISHILAEDANAPKDMKAMAANLDMHVNEEALTKLVFTKEQLLTDAELQTYIDTCKQASDPFKKIYDTYMARAASKIGGSI